MTMKTIIFTLLLLSCSSLSNCISTYSIDLGSDFIKVAIVVPGVPMEVALNGESQRKTPSVVFIKDDERLFGDPAMNMGVKYPKNLYHSLTTLVGKSINHSIVQDFIKNYPYYEIFMNEDYQLAFKDGKNTYTVEELLAMIIENAKTIAETYSEMPMKNGIIVVPPYFTQDERLAVLRSATIAGVNVLQLINSNTAVGLNYGIFRRKSFNSSVQYYMFYDVGSSATVASIIGYQVVKDSEEGMLAESPQLSVIGVGYDRTLGSSQFALRLQMHLAKAFNAAKKTKKDVTTVPRSMAKLYKEATRVMKVLSVNNDIYAQIENVLDDQDFRLRITRAEFEQMCNDLFERFAETVHKALESAQIPMPVIKEIILMGGGTRIPRVQEILLRTSDRQDLGKGINTDEAAALGAVYQAAYISPGFRVQKFLVKDSNLVPVSVDFVRYKIDNGKESAIATSRMLFDFMNPFPQKKAFTFNKHNSNFDFNVTIGTVDIDKRTIMYVSVDNMTAVYEQYMQPSEKHVTEFKGVKTHFVIDNSGILTLNYIESVFERRWNNSGSKEEATAFEKIGNTISNFFGGSENVESNKTVEKETINNTASANGTSANTGNSTKNESAAAKPRIEVIHQNVHFVKTWKSFPIPSEDIIERSRQRALKLRAADDQKMELERAKNELESYIFDVKSRFEKDAAYEACSTAEERRAAVAAAEEAGDWYEGQGPTTGRQEYSDRRAALGKLMANVDLRVRERAARPAAMQKLANMINTSTTFLEKLANLTGDGDAAVLTKTEYQALETLIADTQKWLNNTSKVLESLKPYENPSVTVEDFEPHVRALQREVGYLLNKISIWKSRTPPPAKESANDTTTDKDIPEKDQAKKDIPEKEQDKKDAQEKEQDKKDIPEKEETKKYVPEKEETKKDVPEKEEVKKDPLARDQSEKDISKEVPTHTDGSSPQDPPHIDL